VCFFSTKAFLILAIIIAKIVYLGVLVSCANGVALIIRISRVLSLLMSFIISYIDSYLGFIRITVGGFLVQLYSSYSLFSLRL